MIGASQDKVDRLNAEWRAKRDAPLTECQTSGGPHGDGGCWHKKCPVRGGRDGRCKLPWAWDDYEDE